MRLWLVLLLVVLPVSAAAVEVRVVPRAPRQGDAVLVFVAGTKGAQQVEGSLGAQHLAFFPYGAEFAALTGVDIETKPGKVPWRVGLVDGGGGPRKAAGIVTVKAAGFPVQRLTLPGGMVNLDREAERRAANEAARMRALYDTVTPERLWRGPFTQPAASRACRTPGSTTRPTGAPRWWRRTGAGWRCSASSSSRAASWPWTTVSASTPSTSIWTAWRSTRARWWSAARRWAPWAPPAAPPGRTCTSGPSSAARG